jgi:ABC-2 type transport system permease protein
MPDRYNNLSASFAIARASLISMLRSPTAVVFSLLFPVIFIVVFGSMVDNASVKMQIAFAPDCDTGNMVYRTISGIKMIQPQNDLNAAGMEDALKKGQITAIVDIRNDSAGRQLPHYSVNLITASAAADKFALLQSVIDESIHRLNEILFPQNQAAGTVTVKRIPGRTYQQIDFILPGQLGFSLLMAGVFSSAFLFFNLRQSLVLKRIFATPITRSYLILGELISRLLFQVIGFIIMIGLGHFAFDFTLVNGLITFLELLLFSLFGLLIFMGIGFIISSLIRDEGSISPVANTITLPQILLCGLFFPIENYPVWLQSFCKILPLTILVDGFRKIAFEGMHITSMPLALAGLTCWTLVVGICTVKVFRWE